MQSQWACSRCCFVKHLIVCLHSVCCRKVLLLQECKAFRVFHQYTCCVTHIALGFGINQNVKENSQLVPQLQLYSLLLNVLIIFSINYCVCNIKWQHLLESNRATSCFVQLSSTSLKIFSVLSYKTM